MLFIENLFLAVSAIKANITRSILTMLGIIIGVAAVIAIMELGDGYNDDLMNEFGEDALSISLGVYTKEDDSDHPGQSDKPERAMSRGDYITDDIIDDLSQKFAERITGVAVKFQIGNEAQAIDGSKYANVTVQAVNDVAVEKDDLKLVAGRMPDAKDYENGKRIALVSDYLVNNLYSGDSLAAIDDEISVMVDGRYYTYLIAGVYKYEASDFSFNSEYEENTELYIPLNAGFAQTHKYNQLQEITLVAKDMNDVEKLAKEAESYMNRRFYRDNKYYEIKSYTQASFLGEIQSMMNMFVLAFSIIAGISLLVGGIGVMNIMLVSITERTREIGTRKALGARNSSILSQFIMEAVILCMLGGIIGVGLGIQAGKLLCIMEEVTPIVTPKSIIISMGFSMMVGVFFGYYPAKRAAQMNPIDALRYE